MPFQKNSANRVNFDMMDTAGVYQPAKTVTGQVSLDGAAFMTIAGTIAEIADGAYTFAGLAADFNGDTYTLRFTAAGCRDTFVHGTTESSYTAALATLMNTMGTLTSGLGIRATVAAGSTQTSLTLTAVSGYPLSTVANAYVGKNVIVVTNTNNILSAVASISAYNQATATLSLVSPGLPATAVGDTIEII